MINANRREEGDLFVRTDYKILYEDDCMMALDKPAPLPVHPVGRFKEKNLLWIVRNQLGLEELRMVNRLDSETSGVVIAAKHKEAAFGLASQFEARTVHKEYNGLIFGAFPEKKGSIAESLGYKIENNYHLRVLDPEGETAVTDYEVVEENSRFSLLCLKPQTGRMHQIRAHLALSGHPLVGDKIYIDLGIYDRYVQHGWEEDMLETVKMPRLALHASSLRIRHPRTGQWMEFYSPLPQEFTDFFRSSFLF